MKNLCGHPRACLFFATAHCQMMKLTSQGAKLTCGCVRYKFFFSVRVGCYTKGPLKINSSQWSTQKCSPSVSNVYRLCFSVISLAVGWCSIRDNCHILLLSIGKKSYRWRSVSKKRSAPGVAAFAFYNRVWNRCHSHCKQMQKYTGLRKNAMVYTPAEKIKPIASPFQDERYNAALCINSSWLKSCETISTNV